MVRKNAKDHRAKKNPKSAEAYKEERRQQNAARPFQFWIGGSIAEGGHWKRTTAGRQVRTEN